MRKSLFYSLLPVAAIMLPLAAMTGLPGKAGA